MVIEIPSHDQASPHGHRKSIPVFQSVPPVSTRNLQPATPNPLFNGMKLA
jgi:hypothetical protein